MKKVLITFLIFAFFLLPNKIQASVFCPFDTKIYLKNLASNINYTYDLNEQNGVSFRITLSNIHKNLWIQRKDTGEKYYPDTSKDMSEITLEGFENGKSYQFDVYSNVEDCDDDILFTIYVTLPTYNPYYNLEVCKGLEYYNLCGKWYNHGLSKEKFIEEVNKYRESINKKEEEEEKEKKDTSSFLLEFYLKYYYIILPAIIIPAGIYIYRYQKRERFF